MKKITVILSFLLLLALAFTACKKGDEAFIIDGVTISNGLYAYYKSEAKKQSENEEEIENTALQNCKEYAVLKNFMKENNISVRTYFKRRTAEDTEYKWGMFSDYYKSAGVAKKDVNQAVLHEYAKKELLHYYYGSDGINPVSQQALKEEFVDLYVGFKAISGSLTKVNNMGETVDMTEDEIEQVKKQFYSMASEINNASATIDEINVRYNEAQGLIVTNDLPIILAKENDPMYDKEFFSKVMDIPHGFARVVISDSSIYVILREKIATTDEDAFFEYSSEVLESMKMKAVENKLKKLTEKSTVEQ